ncbi:hypothetical protein M413DRAFT_32794 [Hebeloma cylindrosporum]|uniref:Uncharacterized protein n=1 Tax=Hebeloma cylindrosporum TaxID=76867 RepID=A0A0C3BE67_HEBCY|nr:hypothetical protein M413DRAFT_32794 [Hebeloma cylindrosporum h7]
MGQGISDVFYPDNPNRRARAEQLRADILAYCNSYEEIKTARDKLLKEIGPRLATLLKNEGYDTPEALDAKVKSILTGDNLAQYLRVKCEHDVHSELERTIFSISSYISIGSGVFLGGLALLGIITGGTAFAILGGVAVALAAVAGILALLDVFEGDRERSNLREVIYKLGPERVKARRAQMMMQAISDWTVYIKQCLDSAAIRRNPRLIAEIWEGDFKVDFAKSEHRPVTEWLIDQDRQRGAWTNEDGDWMDQYSGRFFSVSKGVGSTSSPTHISSAEISYAVDMTGRSSSTSTILRHEEYQTASRLSSETYPIAALPSRKKAHFPTRDQEALQELYIMAPDERPKVVLQRNRKTPIYMVVLEAAQELCIAEDRKGEKWEFMPETVTKKGAGIALSEKFFMISAWWISHPASDRRTSNVGGIPKP